jgi:hypothetical protein
VADVISLNKKLRFSAKQEAAVKKKQKIMAVQKVFQCTHCMLKCEKCGTQLEAEAPRAIGPYRVPYRFCESCAEEYIDYIHRLKGAGDPDCYWRNEIWLTVWRTWIDYQGAVDRYMKTKEFVQLLHEIKQTHRDN